MEVETVGLEKLERALGGFDAEQALAPVRRHILEEMKRQLATPPPRPSYPLRWGSARQAWYVKRVLGWGGKRGAYRRSGRLERGWAIVGDALVNRVPYADYVQGEGQQPFHRDTGWTTAQEVIGRALASPALGREVESALDDAL